MVVCPQCKSEIDTDSLYCDQCGDALRICPKCQSLSRGKRCSQCGSPVEAKSGKDVSVKKDARESLYLVNVAQGLRLAVTDGGVIGRKQGAYISAFSSQMYVSGSHAGFSWDGQANRWSITDLESTNGTFVNKVRLVPQQPCFIGKGDRILIAVLEFVVE